MQQYCIKWNNHMKNFQLTLPKYFQNQKFLDCNLLVEGKHLVSCHKFVLDACSDYFSGFLKSKLLDDKNVIICLPNEIKLWEIQALLQFMYHGEVCISQEGLSDLVKCAELLQVKGLCEGSSNIVSKESSNQSKTKQSEEIETVNTAAASPETVEGECEFSEHMIKQEINISDVDSPMADDEASNSKTPQSTSGLIRVKRNLFDKVSSTNSNGQIWDEAKESLVYNKKSMDIYVRSKESEMDASSSRCSSPLMIEQQSAQQFENIVCSPTLAPYQYSDQKDSSKSDTLEEYLEEDDDDDELFIEEANNETLFNMITQSFENCETFSSGDPDSNRKLFISAVQGNVGNEMMRTGQSNDGSCNEMKNAIGGLYLRNPRGNQVRQYDVNALYSALQDVKSGVSIYRAAQTYSIPRKTLRNWMKRLHIKSQFPMPKQLKEAAIRKKNSQIKGETKIIQIA